MIFKRSSPRVIEVDHVDLRYEGNGGGHVEALRCLTLHVEEREFLSLVGPSGCGKSSLLKLLAGILAPTAGNIVVSGSAVRGPIAGVGMAFQNAVTLPWRSVLDNVLLPLEIVEPYRRDFAQRRGRHEARARELLGAVGLGGSENRYPSELSGGMLQRVSLCRALIHHPKVVLLDEPFGALDPFTREELWNVMQGLATKENFTAVLVTHDLREAVYLADTVYVMSARPGTIIARHEIDVARPRRLQDTYDGRLNDAVRVLRADVDRAHNA